jgi:enterochelin esterase family protein
VLALLLAALPATAQAAQAPAVVESVASPAGTIERLEYASEAFGETRGVVVYLPPGYAGSGTRSYPVLYLLHGVMGDETAWSGKGKIGALLDELIANGEIEPLIAVMPLGYGFPDGAARAQEMLSPMTDQLAVAEAFSAGLLAEVMPFVEREFRTRTDAGSRAIAGLSMGGSQALHVGLNHPELFDRVVSLSGAFIMYGGRYDEWFPGLGAAGARLPGLIDLSVGTDDFLLGVNRHFTAWLAERGMEVELREVPGSHEWEVYRRELARVAPRLFPGT